MMYPRVPTLAADSLCTPCTVRPRPTDAIATADAALRNSLRDSLNSCGTFELLYDWTGTDDATT
jgi:hypothetical protein